MEETHTITSEMVATTAGELDQDLGTHLSAPSPASTVTDDDLIRRIESLEMSVARQERVFRRILDRLGQTDGTRA